MMKLSIIKTICVNENYGRKLFLIASITCDRMICFSRLLVLAH